MNRRHDIDVLRILAFALLIAYHIGMVYVADWGFHFKSPHQWEWLQWPMIAVNRWRMSLIFLVSGLALGFALKPHRLMAFAGRRTVRLLLPLVVGIIAVVPIQAYCEAVANGVVEPGLIDFLRRYLAFRPWPEGGFAGAEFGFTWNHLWFLPYLWLYTLLLITMLRLGRAGPVPDPDSSRHLPGHWPAWVLITLPTLYLFAGLYWLEPRFETTHALFDDWFSHATYLPIFLFGFMVARSQDFWRRIDRILPATAGLALLALSVYMGLRVAGRQLSPADLAALPDWDWFAISRFAHATYQWCALLTIIGAAQRWLNRPWSWLPRANEAVYPWYILHQSLIVPLAFYLAPLNLSGGTEVLLVTAGTVLGCLAIHELVLRRSRWLRPLFGMKAVVSAPARPLAQASPGPTHGS
jgi:peptidoglycan/LPS O-acetylase OafA/YrhL